MDREEYQNKLDNCGKRVVILKCKNCGLDYPAPISCGLRTCPKCAKKQADELFFGIEGMVKRLHETKVYKLRLLTLGYGNKGSLRFNIKESKKAFRKLWHNILEKKGTGAVVSVEVGEKNQSVHLHILYYGYFVRQSKLSKEWEKVSGQWYADIRLIKGGAKGRREAIKYVMKGVDKKDAEGLGERFEVEEALRGMRRIMTYGIFYHFKLPKKTQRVLVCPRCGCEEWNYVKTCVSGVDITEEDIRAMKWNFKVLQRARASPEYAGLDGSPDYTIELG